MDANNVFSICKTTSGDLWIGTTSGLLRYNRDTDDFTRMPELANMFVYKILEVKYESSIYALFSFHFPSLFDPLKWKI